ncbi:hypothetical protein GXP67_19020 [Rhodocytophaga rosea]|uniref:Uncharacterized protein n=1 Tax=Rhodocytophaga rosea TaxID=2704465 RepID=A0A6C0GKW6_9BACT|nr:hypothetical protein [Rhodocytophaga rosea]QHT68587.1 hypothetical protein GXP67_19020 [Rhodocytophaga rosea]
MLAYIFLQQALAATPSSSSGGNDLVIILGCLLVLIGMVYLLKFVLEKCGIARRRNLISSSHLQIPENKNP